MGGVVILGVFVADTAYRADRPPRMGETILGNAFMLGPGGKGSNQAVAAARLGAEVAFITRLGDDAFADMALRTWAEAGVRPNASRYARSIRSSGVRVSASSRPAIAWACFSASSLLNSIRAWGAVLVTLRRVHGSCVSGKSNASNSG